MAKKVKFPLVLRDDQRVYTMEELREYFHFKKIYEYFRNGKLAEWLETRYYEEEARQIQELDPQENGVMKKLCRILSVDSAGADLFEKYWLIPCTGEEWKTFLETPFADILEAVSHITAPECLEIIYSSRFLVFLILNCRISMLKGREMEKGTRIAINKLTYDYLTGQVGQPEEEISSLLEIVTRLVNLKDFAALPGFYLSEKLANYMALSGCSSHNEVTNIRRVNFIICTSLGKTFPLDFSGTPPEQCEMAEEIIEEIIIKIYSVLFPDEKILFKGTMLDVWAPDSPWIDKSVSAIYDLITTIVLDMLDQLPLDTIREILLSYVEDYQSIYAPKGHGTRILLKDIPEYYTNIWSVLEEMNVL